VSSGTPTDLTRLFHHNRSRASLPPGSNARKPKIPSMDGLGVGSEPAHRSVR
jgi:hypothetical protein